jgi:hypothetical protein
VKADSRQNVKNLAILVRRSTHAIGSDDRQMQVRCDTQERLISALFTAIVVSL